VGRRVARGAIHCIDLRRSRQGDWPARPSRFVWGPQESESAFAARQRRSGRVGDSREPDQPGYGFQSP